MGFDSDYMKTGHLMVVLLEQLLYKYIGLLFTPKLSWSSAKIKLAAQAKKALLILLYENTKALLECLYIKKYLNSLTPW